MRILFLLLVLFFGIQTTQSQTKLKRAKQSLSAKSKPRAKRTSKNNTNNATNSYNYTDSYDDSDFSFWTSLILDLGWPIIKLGVTIPYYVAIESPWEKESSKPAATMTPYAYANGDKGLYTYENTTNPTKFTATLSDRFVYENQNIQGNHANLNLRFWNRAGLEIDHLVLWENNPNFGKDQFSMLTVLAKYYRVRTERFVGWWGIGINHIGSYIDKSGFAYGLGIEAFVAKPISLEATFNGSIINQEHISRFNSGINYYIKNIKVSGGYEYLQLGTPKFSLFSLGAGISF